MNDLRPVNLTVCRCPLCQTRLQSEDDVRKHIMSHHVGEHVNPSDMYVKIQESVVQYQNNLRELIDLDIRFAGISALLDCLMADAQPCAVDGMMGKSITSSLSSFSSCTKTPNACKRS